jgi:hypothetical protein
MHSINWKYALGEILIVIIGITVAFSMNKCAENSKQKEERQQYLVNIKNDLETDKERLKEIIADLNSMIDTAERILPILNSESKEKMTIVRDLFTISNISNFTPQDNTYHTLINSGDLKLITDFDLKTAIEAHYSVYEQMAEAYKRQENIHKEYLGDYFIHHINYDEFQKGVFGFKDEKLLKNIVQSMTGSRRIKLTATQKGIESCDRLLEKLNKALEL